MTTTHEHPVHVAVASVTERLATLDADTALRVTEATDLSHDEWFALGDKASLALAHGVIEADTAQILYGIHSRWNTSASTAERVVYLEMMRSILGRL
jgi:plasmid maintenance system antidote protein VapI